MNRTFLAVGVNEFNLNFINSSNEKAEKLLDFLIQEQFIQRVDNYTCEFKSLTLKSVLTVLYIILLVIKSL